MNAVQLQKLLFFLMFIQVIFGILNGSQQFLFFCDLNFVKENLKILLTQVMEPGVIIS